MVDFKKKLGQKKAQLPVDPVKLYDTLDRAVDKGPLRPAQSAVLAAWNRNRRNERDIIVKLHTGQGKTLIGLLMLQSRLNEENGPSLYLCPNNLLVEQTREQARKFGISTCLADPDIPESFLEGREILVTSAQKLFNGLTKFGLFTNSISVGTLLMDDSHSCSDAIRDACRIRLGREEPAYQALIDLFSVELEQQGAGTYADIVNKKRYSILPVPYWAWRDRETDVAAILSKQSDALSIKFSWPLLKDLLAQCQCIVSGEAIEIEPYIPPLDAFGSYTGAEQRIFMSATVTDDAFLVKGLRLEPKTIENPITYEAENWSGEKMILIPSLIDDSLNRTEIVNLFGRPNEKRNYGTVVLVPSARGSVDWERYGAQLADKHSIGECLRSLASGDFVKPLVLVNRYDGIDLPDAMCRILVVDSRPYSENLVDLYQESCRPESDYTMMRIVRTVEQGLGRSVRGEKDFSVIVITGDCITRLVRDRKSREYLSNQMRMQIEIGLEVAEMAKEEISTEGKEAMEAFVGIFMQCLSRDEGWKAFYAESMESIQPSGANSRVLNLYASELEAELLFASGDHEGASANLQQILDKGLVTDPKDKGWYLQEIARYNYKARRTDSEKLQKQAFLKNRMLLLPVQGISVKKLTIVSDGRMERIGKWVSAHGSFEQLSIAINDILGRLAFGVRADDFEAALNDLSEALGFVGERPDKEWKEGPDNLWALDKSYYIIWECKSEVSTERAEIQKYESEQMNSSCAWFQKHYKGCESYNLMVIPPHKLKSAAAFTNPVQIMNKSLLNKFVSCVREFFRTFESKDLKNLSMSEMQNLINAHGLSVGNLTQDFGRSPKDRS